MFLEKIREEFNELYEVIGDADSYDLFKIKGELDAIKLLSYSQDIRFFSLNVGMLKNSAFTSKIVKKCIEEYMICIEELFENYDMAVDALKGDSDYRIMINGFLDDSINRLHEIVLKIGMTKDIILDIAENTWEPLPDNTEEDKVQNIIILSETRSMSLSDVSSDVGNLDNFFKNISLLFNHDENHSNNIYMRRVETGSLAVAVSCAMQAAPIIAFIFWCVKLYQKAEKRYLDNADKKLKLINDSMEAAKKILEVAPDNKEAEEIIQKSGLYILDFLENNPIGTINGEHYDIGAEKLKIEKKKD